MKKQAINLGRVGILLPIASFIPFLGTLAGLASLILLLMSHHYFSKVYESPAIFKNVLIGVLVPIISNLIGGIIIAVAAGSAFMSMSSGNMQSPDIQEMVRLILGSGVTIVGAIIMLAGTIIGTYLYDKALIILAEKTGVKHFKTAGLLYFIGALGIILFFIGTLVMFVGWIIHIVAYFSIHADEEAVQQPVL
jgi:uncharacterized membrane protein